MDELTKAARQYEAVNQPNPEPQGSMKAARQYDAVNQPNPVPQGLPSNDMNQKMAAAPKKRKKKDKPIDLTDMNQKMAAAEKRKRKRAASMDSAASSHSSGRGQIPGGRMVGGHYIQPSIPRSYPRTKQRSRSNSDMSDVSDSGDESSSMKSQYDSSHSGDDLSSMSSGSRTSKKSIKKKADLDEIYYNNLRKKNNDKWVSYIFYLVMKYNWN